VRRPAQETVDGAGIVAAALEAALDLFRSLDVGRSRLGDQNPSPCPAALPALPAAGAAATIIAAKMLRTSTSAHQPLHLDGMRHSTICEMGMFVQFPAPLQFSDER
jgi:hypothetical protein